VTDTSLHKLAALTEGRTAAAAAAGQAEMFWRWEIERLIKAGAPAAEVAAAAGVSRQRVYQIRDGRR
jgi:hypothetical protein